MEFLLNFMFVGSLFVWLALLRRVAGRRTLVEFEPRAQVPWSGVDVIVLAISALCLEALAHDFSATTGELEASTPRLIAAAGISRMVWLVFAVIYLSRAAGAYADDMGFDARRLASDLRLAGLTFLAAALPVFSVQFLFTEVLGYKSEHPLVKLVHEEGSAGALLLTTIVAVIVAPLVEEFFFRVVLQGWLEKIQVERRERRGGSTSEPPGFGPIIVAAAIFGLMHAGNGPDPIALFVLSLFLGYVYQRTHRIIAPLAVHACVNGLAMLELWSNYLSGKV